MGRERGLVMVERRRVEVKTVGVEGYQERSKLCIRTWVDSSIYKIDGDILPRNMQPLRQRIACFPVAMIGVERAFTFLLD